jgi:DNA-binding YbaB/EbfC family protein
MDIQAMMKQAQEMQERLQREMSELVVQANSGGGMVTVTMNGHKHVQRITIDPEVVSKDDVAMLQDLVTAAVNDANRKVDDAMKQKMGGLLGGLRLPGMYCRFLLLSRNSSNNSRSCPALARRAHSASPSTCSARRGKMRRSSARRSATSRIALPIARRATTSPTSIPARCAAIPIAITS